jgi:hypothetical protein
MELKEKRLMSNRENEALHILDTHISLKTNVLIFDLFFFRFFSFLIFMDFFFSLLNSVDLNIVGNISKVVYGIDVLLLHFSNTDIVDSHERNSLGVGLFSFLISFNHLTTLVEEVDSP